MIMPRLHTRIKRGLRLNTSKLHTHINIKGKPGAKTFKTEDKAKEYATTTLKLEEGKFDIMPAKKNKKFKVIEK
jgi:hypothetical protein